MTDAEKQGCYDIPFRAYALRDASINGAGYLTGANVRLTYTRRDNTDDVLV